MGRASRRKHEQRHAPPPASERPRWAGAPGFDRAYRLSERRHNAFLRMERAVAYGGKAPTTAGQLDQAGALKEASETMSRLMGHHIESLEHVLGHDPRPPREPPDPQKRDHDFVERKLARIADSEEWRQAQGFGVIAGANLDVMRRATPITFDPLGVPELSSAAADGFHSPFSHVVADFYSNGMSLPLQPGGKWWVGVTAATISQPGSEGPIDVWPTITTLSPDRADDAQRSYDMTYGMVRFGGDLPEPPPGLVAVKIGEAPEYDPAEFREAPERTATAWVINSEHDDNRLWATLWVVAPALAAITAMRLLDAVNVSLEPAALPRAERRRAERVGAEPALTVVVSRSGHAAASPPASVVDWQHRWTVRGHWKHFGEDTAVARRHPSRIVTDEEHGRHVKVWCPPYVKGPADKPLILKTRQVPAV